MLTPGLQRSINLKKKLYVKSIKIPTIHNIKVYNDYRNKLHSLLRRTESDYFDKWFIENRNNLCKSWAIIKEGINKKKENNNASKININGKFILDKKIIPDTFNNFYVILVHIYPKIFPIMIKILFYLSQTIM